MHICRFTERLNLLLGGIDVHTHVLAQFLQHLKDGGQFLFRKHANLKIDVRAPFGLTRQPTLTDQNKTVKKTLSEETTSARTPKGKGSNALSPGITWRFSRHQTKIKINCASGNPMLPTTFIIMSLARSVRVRRLRASCSSLAIASMLYCVGLAATRRGKLIFHRLTPRNLDSKAWKF